MLQSALASQQNEAGAKTRPSRPTKEAEPVKPVPLTEVTPGAATRLDLAAATDELNVTRKRLDQLRALRGDADEPKPEEALHSPQR